jgi:protein-disulfide isomerase
MQEYGDRVIFVFRNFPLVQIHQNAMISAQAAEAAGLQGKYWEMHDLLYEKQTEWSNAAVDKVVAQHFQGYAQSLGLDVQKFLADIEGDAVKQKIEKDISAANAAEVDHTPTFFINLAQIPNPQNYAQFTAAIDAALASTTASQ